MKHKIKQPTLNRTDVYVLWKEGGFITEDSKRFFNDMFSFFYRKERRKKKNKVLLDFIISEEMKVWMHGLEIRASLMWICFGWH